MLRYWRETLSIQGILLLLTLFFIDRSFALNSSTTRVISPPSRCPVSCDSAGLDSTAWTYYHDFQVFSSCDQTIIFESNLYNSVDDAETHVSLRACMASGSSLKRRDLKTRKGGGEVRSTWKSVQKREAAQAVSWSAIQSTSNLESIATAVQVLSSFIQDSDNFSGSLFSRVGDAIAGFYTGPGIEIESAIAVIDAFASASRASSASQKAVQWCGSSNGTADRQSFGVVINTSGDVSAIQDALASWADGECLEGDSSDVSWWSDISSPPILTTSNSSSSGNSSQTRKSKRDTCSYIQAESGDGCYSLAQRCGITQDELESYNGGASFCDSVQVDQYVCCSSGTLPDLSPQPTDGNCYAYTIQSGDTCSAIATAYQMDVSGIEDNNDLTWGWMGCSDLQIGQVICLSSGNPPFPTTVANAVCGPQVNDTTPTSDPLTWSDLNPCPLNACCDIWGQCGITSEFCTADPADTGAPGTAQPGSNGCISNCGTDIVSSAAPDSFSRVGYFEAWNTERPCLNMWVS